MPTPLYLRRSQVITDTYNHLDRVLFTPWAFFNTGTNVTVSNCEGRQLHIGSTGIEFSGSARDVFWSFFDADLRKVITEQIDATVKECEGIPALLKPALDETRGLLHGFVARAYERLAEIDQRLRGKGYPNSVSRKPVNGLIRFMQKTVDDYVQAALDLRSLATAKENLVTPDQDNIVEFTYEERQQVKLALSTFRVRLIETFNPTEEQLRVISERLDYLSGAVDRLNRFDWKEVAVSTLFSIATTLTLDVERGRQLWGMFQQALSTLIQLIR